MKEKDKEVLLKDLSARLPYGVKFETPTGIDILKGIDHFGKFDCTINPIDDNSYDVEDIKPYLFPMCTMTKEQKNEYHELVGGMFGTSVLINFEFLEDFFYRNHLDCKGLIPMGLALDATGKNIYIDYAQR
ncbi:MAG: hypothetical protein J6U90_03740 [Methanobrevibacter sp.]|nr:hypothetical protein [Methanobrevibacter sp.]